MALDSLIGFDIAIISAYVAPTFVDSPVGYQIGTLANPAATGDSAIGFAVATLNDPVVASDSRIGYVIGNLTDPVIGVISDSSIGFNITTLTDATSSAPGDSRIGFTVGFLTGPEGYTDSRIGFTIGTLRDNSSPFRIWDGEKYVLLEGRMWRDGGYVRVDQPTQL